MPLSAIAQRALVHRFVLSHGATFIHEVSGMKTILIVLLVLLVMGAFLPMFLVASQ